MSAELLACSRKKITTENVTLCKCRAVRTADSNKSHTWKLLPFYFSLLVFDVTQR